MRTKTAHQRRVEEFMVKARQEMPDRPTLPDEKTRLLRAKLILEEALETVAALGIQVSVVGETGLARVRRSGDEIMGILNVEIVDDGDLEEIADGCADIIVVTTGTLSACGISDDSVQREVDCNNLAKFEHRCPKCGRLHEDDRMTEAQQLVHVQPMTAHGENAGKPGNRACLSCGTIWQSGHHNDAGKWVKPANHKPPRVAEVLAEQTHVVEQAAKETVELNAVEDPSCFGNYYTPSSKRCGRCPKSRRERCIEEFVGA